MKTVWIVLPILSLLMFDMGLTLSVSDFKRCFTAPKSILVGLAGQIVLLPLIAVAAGRLFDLDPIFFMGLILIACSPGGSSSNVFSMIARGNVALSVSLTALSSLITFFTIPLIMVLTAGYLGRDGVEVNLPVGNLIMQNLVLTLLPVGVGLWLRKCRPQLAEKWHPVLSKLAFPAIIFLALLFFVANRQIIAVQIWSLGPSVALLMVAASLCGGLMARAARLDGRDRRTIVIEVGMQNAAQAMAIASSPFVFDSTVMAVPAIIYALIMNVVLIGYVYVVSLKR